MGQFVHADVSNIDIEERSKKMAVYENELKVDRIPFPSRCTCSGDVLKQQGKNVLHVRQVFITAIFMLRDKMLSVIESLINRPRAGDHRLRNSIHFSLFYNLFKSHNAVIQSFQIFAILIYFLLYK